MAANISEVQLFQVQYIHLRDFKFLCDLSHNVNKIHSIFSLLFSMCICQYYLYLKQLTIVYKKDQSGIKGERGKRQTTCRFFLKHRVIHFPYPSITLISSTLLNSGPSSILFYFIYFHNFHFYCLSQSKFQAL